MRILFVYPNVSTRNGPHYQHGVGSLVAVLKRAGHEVRLAYLQTRDDLKDLPDVVRTFAPRLAAISFGTNQWPIARLAAEAIKGAGGAYVVCGGVHATFQPDEVIANPHVDAVCVGEGEGALVELADALESSPPYNTGLEPLAGEIGNLWVKLDGEIVRNPLRPLIDDLDSLPLGDRGAFPMRDILEESAYEMSMMASRGCPLACTYCCNHAWARLYRGLGRYVRFRSVDSVLGEIDMLARSYRIETIYFEDDIFTLKRPWTYEFAQKYPKRFDFPFRIYVRAEAIDLDMLKALKQAGLYMINIGLESGDEHIRRDVMKRNMTDVEIERVFDWAKELGIIVRDFNIVGTPGETWETVKKTVEMNRRVLPDQIQVSIFYPYPGTELYEMCKQNGWIAGDEERLTYFDDEGIVDLPTMSRAEIAEAYRWACEEAQKLEKRKDALDFERTKSGYFDFIEHLDEAELTMGEPSQLRRDRVIVRGERRFVIFEHPRARLLFKGVRIEPSSVLSFGIALDPRCLGWGGVGVRFIVTAACGDEKSVIFDRYIDPKHDPAQNKWHDFSIPLDAWAGRAVNFVFETQPDESGELTGAWSVWSRPCIGRVEAAEPYT